MTASTYFASDGAAYDRFLGRWTIRLAAAFAEFAHVPPGDVLEIGCGTGNLSAALLSTRPEGAIVGVDVAEPYLEVARTRHASPRLRFEKADAARLPFPDGRFAGAVTQLVLSFVPDYPAAAREMRRVTRPGGVAAAAIWDFRGGLVYSRLLWDNAAAIDPVAAEMRNRLMAHPLGQVGGLLSLWQQTGFAACVETSLTIRMDFASFDDFWEPMLGGQGSVGSYVRGLAPEKATRVREQVRAAYLTGTPDGPLSMAATAWAVRGVVP